MGLYLILSSVCCMKEARDEPALGVRTTSKTPLFPSAVSALIRPHKCHSQQTQRTARGGRCQPTQGLPAPLLPGEGVSAAFLSNARGHDALSCKQHSSMNVRRKSL